MFILIRLIFLYSSKSLVYLLGIFRNWFPVYFIVGGHSTLVVEQTVKSCHVIRSSNSRVFVLEIDTDPPPTSVPLFLCCTLSIFGLICHRTVYTIRRYFALEVGGAMWDSTCVIKSNTEILWWEKMRPIRHMCVDPYSKTWTLA